MSSNATVTIPLTEFMEVQNARAAAEQKAAALEKQLNEAKIAANDATTYAIARDALEVVRFAIGNLPPETTRGWPVSKLRALSENLPKLDGASQDDQEYAITMRYFADEIEKCEAQRRAQGITKPAIDFLEAHDR